MTSSRRRHEPVAANTNDPHEMSAVPPVGPRSPWAPVDLTPALDGTWEPATPTVGERLFYPGKCHTIASETEAGKTWLALAAAVHELDQGEHVLYIDFEDDAASIVTRLMALNVDHAQITNQFHYVRPTQPVTTTGVHRAALTEALAVHQPSLVVLDGITEAMVLHSLNPLDNGDAARFGRLLPRPIADAGPAVVSLDHVTKTHDHKGRYALGAVHKLNALDGAAYVLDARDPLSPGMVGRSTIRVAKDRPGRVRARSTPPDKPGGLPLVGNLVLDATRTPNTLRIEPAYREATTTPVMAAILTVIRKNGPMSKRDLRDAVTGRSSTIDTAIQALITAGELTPESPYNTPVTR